jgi:hypothetical protein
LRSVTRIWRQQNSFIIIVTIITIGFDNTVSTTLKRLLVALFLSLHSSIVTGSHLLCSQQHTTEPQLHGDRIFLAKVALSFRLAANVFL